MNQNQVNFITCSHCNEFFSSKGKYQSHYTQKHQNEIRIKEGTTVFRSQNGKFICICEKEFELGKSLKRHYKNCIKVHEKELENEQGKIYFYYLFY
jgi:hypothetical protein